PGPDGAALIGPGVGLEIHPVGRANAEMYGERRTAEGGIAAHGGVGSIGVVVDHAGGAGMRARPDEDDAVGPDARSPRAHGLHVLRRTVAGRGRMPAYHDGIVARS